MVTNTNHFPYPGSAYFFNEDLPISFQNSPYTRSEDSLAEPSMSYNIDPSLQSPSASSDPYFGHWDHQQQQQHHQFGLEKYLQDDQKTTLFNISEFPSKMTPNRAMMRPAMMRPAMGIPPVPPASHSHVRFASPISSEGPSSSSDNMHSPPTDTDSPYESFGSPAADPASLQLPFTQQAPYDSWNAVQFMGMGLNRDIYVNPNDVNPNQQPVDYLETDSSNVEFSLPARGYSFESYTTNSQCEMEPLNNTAAIDLPVRRLASPEPIQPAVKEEINASSQCPPPPRQSHDAETEESDAEPLQPAPKRRKSNDDDDYKPKEKPGRRQSRRSPKSQPPVALTTISPPPKQRTKPAAAAASGLNNPAKPLPPPPTIYSCPDCSHPHFKDQNNLDAHIKKQHTRPFTCVFHFAGCKSTFASKNEWKRHVSSQHILLNYWLCDEGPCAGAPAGKTSGATRNDFRNNTTTTTTNGVIFNRKDLYTQHVRRMHMPPQIKKVMKASSTTSTSTNTTKDHPQSSHPEWDSRLKEFQSRAVRERCQLPVMMACPAPKCDAVFHGPESWDQRMEHVARHLERAAQGSEGPVVFGGEADETLVDWARSEVVGIIKREGNGNGWVLNSLLKRGGNNGAYCVQGQGLGLHQGGEGVVVLGGRKERGRREVAVCGKRDEEIKSEIVVSDGEDYRDCGEIVVHEMDDDLRDAEGEEDD